MRVVSSWKLAALVCSLLAAAPSLYAQPDTFRWMGFHGQDQKDQDIVVWVARALAGENWTSIREIGVEYDAALVVTAQRANPQAGPADDSFRIWSVNLTNHALTPLLTGYNLRWLPFMTLTDGGSPEPAILYDNCAGCAADTYFTAFHYDRGPHSWAARWMRGGQGVPVGNANPPASWASLTARPGWLRLASVPVPPTRNNGAPTINTRYDAPNFLLQKFPAPEFTVTTRMDFVPAADGEIAGLAVFGFDYAVLGLRRTADGMQVVEVVNQGANRAGAQEHELSGPVASPSPVYLRVRVDDGARCQFAYSFDNQTFTPIGTPFKASGDRWIGARVGLIASAPPGASVTGHADFDWFHVTANRTP